MARVTSELEIAVTVGTNMKFHWLLIISAVLMIALAALTAGIYIGRLAEHGEHGEHGEHPAHSAAGPAALL